MSSTDIMKWMSNIEGSIEQVAGYLGLNPLVVYGIIILILCALLLLLHRHRRKVRWTLDRLRSMDDKAFEELIGTLWQKLGYKTTVTQRSRDKGIDVIAERKRLFGKERIAIQAKRYAGNHKVGVEEVMRYASIPLRDKGINSVIIVTTGEFTKTARDDGRKYRTIKELIDGRRLVELLNQHLKAPGKAKARKASLSKVLITFSRAIVWLLLIITIALLANYVTKGASAAGFMGMVILGTQEKGAD